VSALDRFYNGMSPEDMVLNLLATAAHVSEEEAARALQFVKDEHAHELAEKIENAMEEARAADWGRSSRTKRPYLQGMERAKKAIGPEVLNDGVQPS
jgi:hypothetical protein